MTEAVTFQSTILNVSMSLNAPYDVEGVTVERTMLHTTDGKAKDNTDISD